MYPLELPPSSSGSFGELRVNHFHSGVDFKTNHRTGYPVHAAADGYISRLKVLTAGFGNVIYITHPNGYTTVYGHLERFNDEIAKLVKARQYKLKSFEVDIILKADQLPVVKNELIAFSGNSGAAEGPHLHFEIRDMHNGEPINPQLFGLNIPDTVPPVITGMGIYQLDGNAFSEKTPRKFFEVSGKAGVYNLINPGVIHLNGSVGFGISCSDPNGLNENIRGVYSVVLKMDGKIVYNFSADRFSFNQTHAINAYIDYPEFVKDGHLVQKCFKLPGTKISIYQQAVNKGIVVFNDNALHRIDYLVKDVAGNTSRLSIQIKAGTGSDYHPVLNTQQGILFHYDKKNEFSNKKVKVVIMPGNLYDDVDFTYSTLPKKPGMFSVVHCIHNVFTPVHSGYYLWIKPDADVDKYTSKLVIANTDGSCTSCVYEDGYVKTLAHSFGCYFITADTVPPTILPINIKNDLNLSQSKEIQLKIDDELSGIKSFNGKIDGKWVLMELDFKTKILSYTFENDILAGIHKFELIVTDNKNNSSIYKANFYR